jgi:hypothetical protein
VTARGAIDKDDGDLPEKKRALRGIAKLTATPESEPLNRRPAHAPWLEPFGSYDRRENREFQVSRYG